MKDKGTSLSSGLVGKGIRDEKTGVCSGILQLRPEESIGEKKNSRKKAGGEFSTSLFQPLLMYSSRVKST